MTERQVGIAIFCLLVGIAAVTMLSQIAPVVGFVGDHTSDLIRVGGNIIAVAGGVILWNLRVRSENNRDRDRRNDRQMRLLAALRAEISMQLENYVDQFEGANATSRKAALLDGIDKAKEGEHSMPIGVVPKENDVFDHIKAELADLPADVIEPVIKYYQADEYVVELIKAFTAGIFEKKDVDKRKLVIEAYFAEGLRAAEAGRKAITVLDKNLEPQQ